MITEILITVLIVSCVLYYYAVWHFFEYKRIKAHVNKIPGPFCWPIFGNLPYLNVSTERIWTVLRKWDVDYYPIYKIWNTHRVIITVLDADDVETILSSMRYIEKSGLYSMLHAWLGTGLLTSTGAKWQKRRKILTPAFHFNVLKKFAGNMVENGEKVVEFIKSKGSDVVLDVVPLVTDYALNVISETAMDSSLEDKHDKNYRDKYLTALHELGEIIIYRLMNPWFQVDWTFRWTARGRLQKKCLNILHTFTNKLIDYRKEYHEKTNGQFLKNISSEESDAEAKQNEISIYRKKRLAMLDLLIAAQRDEGKIDDEGIREEVDTFMFEGHDTSAMGLAFALSLIAEHKDAQDRIRSEVNEVLAESDGKMSMSEIQRFSYTELVVKECLRLYPSVPLISRIIGEDLKLKNYFIPSGTFVNIPIYSIHRDPKHWKDPEKFDPERFLPDRFAGHHPYSYIPFSAGPRNCIGQKFAMLELKAFVAHIVHNFYLEAIDNTREIPLLANMVIRPTCPIRVKFVQIEK